MSGPTRALPANDPLWSGLRQWVELDPANGGPDDATGDDPFDDAPPPASFVPPPLKTERPAG